MPLPLFEDMLEESMPSSVEGGFSLSSSYEDSSRYGSKEDLNIVDPFWEFIGESKYPSAKTNLWGEPIEEDAQKPSEEDEEEVEEEEEYVDYDGGDEN